MAQNLNSVRQQIQHIVAGKKATVGIALMSDDGKDTASIYGNRHFPLQSVFKFHIALAMLSQIDQGKFSLDQPIKIQKKDLLPKLYSPIRDKYPNGTTMNLSEMLAYTVSQSDNVGCDLLLKLLGGPEAVERYIKQSGTNDISIKVNEETQQANWDLQFKNWTTPRAAVNVLQTFYVNRNKRLSTQSHDFIWTVMKGTQTGQARLKGQLPKQTIVAHKTGSSGTNKAGITAAVNDIGIVFLPNGRYYFISVFVKDSRENEDTNEKLIADIGKATWDYFMKRLQ
ncbi:class A beta-lactamase, subclass A2 [Spirosoma aerolatum]|uniref:class A beta-lactamase, subclass A2 n=1 Tax=Spirosoma aerolatum TaxID=1211326 RepID=UPI001FECA301|nr:class A beta-lactamase, subclass A2 [Spirosoma aerolatum]